MTITEENAKTKSEISALIYAHKMDDFRQFTSLVERMLEKYKCTKKNQKFYTLDEFNLIKSKNHEIRIKDQGENPLHATPHG